MIAEVWWQTPGLFGGGIAVVTMLLTSIAAAMVWRKFAPMQTAAMSSVLMANTALAETQERHLIELKKERDDYRNKLHEVRDVAQASQLRIKELEQQPNLSTITTLLENQSKVTNEIVKAFQEHAAADAAVFEKFQQVLERMNDNFESHRTELLDRLSLKPLKRRVKR